MAALTFGLGVICYLASVDSGRASGTSPGLAVSDPSDMDSARTPETPAGNLVDWVTLVTSRDLVQGARLILDPVSGRESILEVRWAERDPASGVYQRTSQRFSTSFEPTLITCRIADDLFLAGQDSTGMTSLERWRIESPEGAIVATRPQAPEGIGVSYDPSVVTVYSPKGGTYLPSEQRTSLRSETRALIRRWPAGVVVSELEADPDGRFLIVRVDDFYQQIDLYDGNATTQIVDLSSLSPLALKANSLSVMQSKNQQRVYVNAVAAGEVYYDYYLVLEDDNNDGVFLEGIHEYDYTQYRALYPADEWQDLFK